MKRYETIYDFLADIGNNMKGVFTTTMLHSDKLRNHIKTFIKRNPTYFDKPDYKENGLLKIIKISREGKKAFDINGYLSKGQHFDSLLDIALVNAWMIENDCVTKYEARPESLNKINGKVVGILSRRWGIPEEIKKVDLLLGMKSEVSTYLSSPEYLKNFAFEYGIRIQDLKRKIEKTITPIALKNSRV